MGQTSDGLRSNNYFYFKKIKGFKFEASIVPFQYTNKDTTPQRCRRSRTHLQFCLQ